MWEKNKEEIFLVLAICFGTTLATLAVYFTVEAFKPGPVAACLSTNEQLERISNKRKMCIAGQNLIISDQKVLYDPECNILIKGTTEEERELMIIQATCSKFK